MRTFKVAVIPGDGCGPELTANAGYVLDAVISRAGIEMLYENIPISAERYLQNGFLTNKEDFELIEKCNAVLLGALGDSRLPVRAYQQQGLLELRWYFDQYINLRPIDFIDDESSSLKKIPKNKKWYLVRENTEDFYVGLDRKFKKSTTESLILNRKLYDAEFAVNIETKKEDAFSYAIGILSKSGCERIARHAFSLARQLGLSKITCADKSNTLCDYYGLWKESVSDVQKDFPEIAVEFMYVDSLAMQLAKDLAPYSLILAPNLFGDILADILTGLQGSDGLGFEANINPSGLSMYMPICGPKNALAGTGLINPTGVILATAHLLETLGEHGLAQIIRGGVKKTLEDGVRTPDIGGNYNSKEVCEKVISECLKKM